MIVKYLIAILLGFSAGGIVAGGIFAFISVIGVVPRFAQKTNTIKYMRFYEDIIVLGGLWGSSTLYIDYTIGLPYIAGILLTFLVGVFVGCMAVSLAEVFDVVPIFMRRARLTRGIAVFITVIALGKITGSLLYFLIPSFTI